MERIHQEFQRLGKREHVVVDATDVATQAGYLLNRHRGKRMRQPTRDSRAAELYHLPEKHGDPQALVKQYEKSKGHPAPAGLNVHQLVAAIVLAEYQDE